MTQPTKERCSCEIVYGPNDEQLKKAVQELDDYLSKNSMEIDPKLRKLFDENFEKYLM